MISMIDIKTIENHPLNPRKDLGDLTELADSIKETGILQNLTLVEQKDKPGHYFTVIGNRRLAASKLVGLEEVPCVISQMDHKTQLSTMLLENMQRVDLTPYEQAQGFQMMIDVGETLENISQKTGFSETTVRRRVKLLELDQGTLKEVSERQPNLTDFIELEKIKNIEERNEVLKTIGTSDFNYKIKSVIERQVKEEIKNKIIEILNDKGLEKVVDRSNKRYKKWIEYNEEGIKEIEILNEGIKYYEVFDYGINLYADDIQDEVSEEEKEKERIRREERQKEDNRRNKLKELSERTSKLRKEFIESISNTKARKNIDSIIEFAIYGITTIGYASVIDISKALNIETDKAEEDITWKDISKEIWKQPELNLLLAIYSEIEVDARYHTWNYEYKKDEDLDEIYKFLEKLGYRMSEEEKKLQDGTHELFIVE